MTCGTEASNFDELLTALSSCEETKKKNLTESTSYFGLIRMRMTASGLSTPHFLSRRKNENFRNFTVSIFLIPCFSRQCCHPSSVFDNVRKKLEQSDCGYDSYFIRKFSQIRRWCEINVREFYKKSVLIEMTTIWKSSCRKFMTTWQHCFLSPMSRNSS